MKKILYITRKEVPYKVKFFNELAQHVDLTVLFETSDSTVRNSEWAKSEKNKFKYIYLDKGKLNNKFITLKILKYVFFDRFDEIIFGCITEKCELWNILLCKMFRKKYTLNIDGEYFLNEKNLKTIIKRFFIKGANCYFVAGEKSCNTLKKYVRKKCIPYYFSSLSLEEIKKRQNEYTNFLPRENFILVVGQYFDYKGLDIACQVAKKMPEQKFKFVGMGYRTEEFKKYVVQLNVRNVEIIPFLQKNELEEEYKKCKMLLLPSRKECWGLVINEAASFGTPIVSTYGSGAAIEFLDENYSQFLAKPNDIMDLYQKINNLNEYTNIKEYSQYLMRISKKYNIENSVFIHLKNIV